MTDCPLASALGGIERFVTWGLVAVLAAGCLPRGAPPAGRQVVADRQSKLGGLVPPTGDGVLRMLVTRPGSTTDAADLYVVSVDPGGGAPVERLLVSDVSASGLGCNFGVVPCSSITPGGVWTYRANGGPVLVDAVTGDIQELAAPPESSPGGRRFAVTSPLPGGPTTLYGPVAQAVEVDDAIAWQFIGDDFYYESAQGDLMDIPLAGAPQKVATGLLLCASRSAAGLPSSPCTSFWGQITPDGVALFLEHQMSDPNRPWFIRDPLSGAETAVPFDASYALLSPDGRWVLDARGAGNGQFTFFDYRAGATMVVDLPGSPSVWVPSSRVQAGSPWRPGTSEVWVSNYNSVAQGTWIVDPTKPPVSVSGTSVVTEGPPGAPASQFTPDGAYWFSTVYGAGMPLNVIQVGGAADPTGPRVDLNTPSQYLDPLWQFADGRLLLGLYVKMQDFAERTDATLFDPRTGESSVLGERGRIAAVGNTRMMGMFHLHEERGDLTVVDPSTGKATILAPEFATRAFAEPQGADQLAPGTRIAYQFQARTESPYDGIWIVDSP